jgi:hypothetical protein
MVSTSIEILDLSSCNLRDEGGKIVADAVSRNYALKVTLINFNKRL